MLGLEELSETFSVEVELEETEEGVSTWKM
jgi:hypothetical protein